MDHVDCKATAVTQEPYLMTAAHIDTCRYSGSGNMHCTSTKTEPTGFHITLFGGPPARKVDPFERSLRGGVVGFRRSEAQRHGGQAPTFACGVFVRVRDRGVETPRHGMKACYVKAGKQHSLQMVPFSQFLRRCVVGATPHGALLCARSLPCRKIFPSEEAPSGLLL